MITAPSVPRVVVYEGPRSEALDSSLRTRLLQNLLERGYAVRRVGGPEVSVGDHQTEEPLVLGCFRGQLPEHQGSLPVRLRDITGLALDEILALVVATCTATAPTTGKRW